VVTTKQNKTFLTVRYQSVKRKEKHM